MSDRSGTKQFIQRKLLEHQMRLAPFVDDADVSIVHAGQARITRPAAFVEQQVMRLGPGAAVVETDLDRVVRPALAGVCGLANSSTCLFSPACS